MEVKWGVSQNSFMIFRILIIPLFLYSCRDYDLDSSFGYDESKLGFLKKNEVVKSDQSNFFRIVNNPFRMSSEKDSILIFVNGFNLVYSGVYKEFGEMKFPKDTINNNFVYQIYLSKTNGKKELFEKIKSTDYVTHKSNGGDIVDFVFCPKNKGEKRMYFFCNDRY